MTTLTARTPEDLLAVVPVVLGFEPSASLVMLTVEARQTFHARVDLPPDVGGVDEVVEVLLAPAARHGARSVVVLLYTDDDALARAVVRRVRQAAQEPGRPELLEALRVHDRYWFPLLHGPRSRTGVPYDVSSHPFVVEAVWAGRVLHRSRADLAATLHTDPAAVAEVVAARGGHAGGPAWIRATLARLVGRPEPPPAAMVAALLEAIRDPDLRDLAWGPVRRADAGEHVRFWLDVLRRTPEDRVSHAAAVLAMCAWIAGDGALAWCAVDRARESEPGHTLARLVADLLTAAVPPSAWPATAGEVTPPLPPAS